MIEALVAELLRALQELGGGRADAVSIRFDLRAGRVRWTVEDTVGPHLH